MNKQIDVVCIKHGNKIYDWSYVDKLYRGVTRSFSTQVNFTVFTDQPRDDSPYNQCLLPDFPELEGWERNRAAWWYKIYLFSKLHPVQKQFFYFDLDVMFTGNCDFLLDVPEDKFAIVSETKWTVGRKSLPLYNSSVMVINPNYHDIFWNSYINRRDSIQNRMHGDQSFISYLINTKNIDIISLDQKKIVYWKWHVFNGGLKERIIKSQTTVYNDSFKSVARHVYHTPGHDLIDPETSIVIFNGAKCKPALYEHRKVVKEFWV